MAVIYSEILKSVFKKPHQLPRLLLSSWSTYRSSQNAYALPLRLHLEQGTVCNLNCRMCPRTLITRSQGMLSLDKFKHIYDQIKPLYINLTGFGESFLNPDILKMVNYAKKHGSYTKLDTNGILVNRQIAQKIIKSQLDLLSFSIDAADAETYKRIRRADKFELVINNLRSLIQIRNFQKSPLKVHVAMVTQKDNLNQLIRFIKMMDKIGVDRINSVYLVEQEVPLNKKFLLNKSRRQLRQIIKEYYKIKSDLHTEVDIHPLEEFANEKTGTVNKNGACFMPWHSTHITYNGDVQPCPLYYNNQIKVGNVFEEDFKKIWNNSIYQNFRHKLIHNRKELPICNGCDMNEEYILKKISFLKKNPYLRLLSERFK